MKLTKQKVYDKIWYKLVRLLQSTPVYLYIYRSYWHYLFHPKRFYEPTGDIYYGARPNPGAGIGHQMANWIDGYYWATRKLHLKFAHFPFSTKQWDDFLGFGYGEATVPELRQKGYILRRLPQFSENDPNSIELVKSIIASYRGKKIIFWPPQDHFYKEQYGVMKDIQQKFYNAPSRKYDKLIYDKANLNIAIHVRRGDIMTDPSNLNLSMRYLSNDYFEKVLKQVTENLNVNKSVHIYFFSQGKPEDYPEFATYKNLHWCLDMGAQDSFLHMVYADILITSKSSFSYKPALLNRGVKICPRNFWHEYPSTPDWILAENDGSLEINRLKSLFR